MSARHASGPTQVRRPWQAVLRTIVAEIVALAPLAPALVDAIGLPRTTGIGLVIVTVSGAITRILAIPGVDQWLMARAPWLAADPPPR